MNDAPVPSFGPYADGPPVGRLLGEPIGAMEGSRLFAATSARMRRMVGRDRVYVSELTDFQLHLDDEQRVVALTASLLPPDQEVADEVFGFAARRDGEDIPMAYTWALLLQVAHEVLALPAATAAELLNGIYTDGYLPRDIDDVRVALLASKRFESGQKALCLLVGLKEVPG